MIQNPTYKQKMKIRIMIVIGVLSILFFLYKMLSRSIIYNPILYVLLIISFIITLITVLIEWYYYWDITVPSDKPVTKKCSVDIFTTFCQGEPYEMIVETLTAIQAITYPHTTYLCDEANDAYLKKVCEQLGVMHVTRENKIDAKAGNINNALKKAKGELCVVLDPDHVPQPNFLDSIVGHFDDDKVGFVQIVQAYKNFEENLITKGAAQQTFHFYGPMMMTMNAYGTVLAIGANCTFRRAALDSIGGHAAGLAEDMNTAMQLHAKGWESVYVPQVLARGLVPSTLSAYYKQQLKWSKGVFDLWLTTFIHCFKQFTFRQKIQYFTIPFFYLSGFVSLINFLIPIFTLFFDAYPIRYDFSDFFLLGAPVFSSVIILRLAVQHWVMEENERGFHVVGGLLFIGTWWIYILGIVYAFTGKELAYIPTQKDSRNGNNFWINLPNIVLFLLSIAAIVYGVIVDWNPFTMIMVSMAALNCLILLFVFYAGIQTRVLMLLEQRYIINLIANGIHYLRGWFWILRHNFYRHFRKIAFAVFLLMIGWIVYEYYNDINEFDYVQSTELKNEILLGFKISENKSLSTSFDKVNLFQQQYSTHANILVQDIPFDPNAVIGFYTILSKRIFQNNSILFINLNCTDWLTTKEKNVDTVKLHNIVDGKLDSFITEAAIGIKKLSRPVYLCINLPEENINNSNVISPDLFKRVWRHAHDVFVRNKVFNVIWFYKKESVQDLNDYFPGVDDVDQIGVTLSKNNDETLFSVQQDLNDLLVDFNNTAVSRMGLPVFVIVEELKNNFEHDILFDSYTQTYIKQKLTNFKGLIFLDENYFNNATDINALKNTQNLKTLQTRLTDFTSYFKQDQKNKEPSSLNIFSNIKGVNYSKTIAWRKNPVPLTRKEIQGDFSDMKELGVNTIKVFGPNIYYDRLLFSLVKEYKLNVQYSFWIPDEIDFLNNKKKLKEIADNIISFVRENKNNRSITTWNIGNAVFQRLSLYYSKPELFDEQFAYLKWLINLCNSIKKEDGKRPITVDVEATSTLDEAVYYLKNINTLNAVGLVIPNKNFDTTVLHNIPMPNFISSCSVKLFLKWLPTRTDVFIKRWQDQQAYNIVALNGLYDFYKRKKDSFYKLQNFWNNTELKMDFPEMKIMVPALTPDFNAVLPYHILIKENGQWKIVDNTYTKLKFEWYLIKTNNHSDDGILMKLIDQGPTIKLRMPQNASQYKILLIAVNDDSITTIESPLSLSIK